MKANMKKKLFLILSILVLAAGNIAFAEVNSEAKLYYNKGVDLYKIGQFEQAAQLFQRAINADANYIDAYYNLGVVLELLNDRAGALNVFKQIIVRKPTDYEAVYNAAELSVKLGQVDNAKQYLSIIPQNSSVAPRAQQLALSLNTDLQTIQKDMAAQKEVAQRKIPQTVGAYNDIPSPTGITSDKDGNVYIASFSNNSITKITPSGVKSVFAKGAELNGPIDIASDPKGNIYVANYNSNNIIKISPSGAFAHFLSNVKQPYCLHIADGMIFISSQGSNTVIRQKI